MENERFLNGDLDTHFIDSEVTLFDSIKKIAEDKPPLSERLPVIFAEKKKIAAVAVAALVAGSLEK
jgi:hypothetical protein